ncbi:putative 13K protein [Pyrrhocoris apterus virus 1]|nr:putative 13K protein [Pyrrhocoris apterus virus 1]
MSLTDFEEVINNFLILFPRVRLSGLAIIYKPFSHLVYSASFSSIPPYSFNLCSYADVLRFFRSQNFGPFKIKELSLIRFRQNDEEQHRWQVQFTRSSTFVSQVFQ